MRFEEVKAMTSWYRTCLLFTCLIAAGSIVSSPASAQVEREHGKAWGDECIRTTGAGSSGPGADLSGMIKCCENQAKRTFQICSDDPTNVVCVNTVNVCRGMVECDYQLDQCKIKVMETDKSCSTPECEKCTSDYKICHDSAVN